MIFRILCILIIILSSPVATWSQDDLATAAQKETMETFAAGRTGAVVWESARTGEWQIYKRNLDGSGFKKISNSGAQKECARISDDGQRVAYISTTGSSCHGQYGYFYTGCSFDIFVCGIEGDNPHKVCGNAYGAGESRAIEWMDNDHLAIIVDGGTYRYHIPETGMGTRAPGTLSVGGKQLGPDGLICSGANIPEASAVTTPDGQWAYTANGMAATLYSIDENWVLHRAHGPMSSCQSEISRNSKYCVTAGYQCCDFTIAMGSWSMAGYACESQGPYGYDYFPTISNDCSVGAKGIAPGHDFNHQDYEIFCFNTSEDNQGRINGSGIVRYTFHGGSDRVPHVWISTGPPQSSVSLDKTSVTLSIEDDPSVTLTATVKNPEGGETISWEITEGGGSLSATSGETVTFTHDGEGTYKVTASISADKSTTATISVIDPTKYSVKVNCGGGAVGGSDWVDDGPYVSGGQDFSWGQTPDPSGVTNAGPAEIYATVRHMSPHSYTFPVPDGDYTVRMHFVDLLPSLERSVTYRIEGVAVETAVGIPQAVTVKEYEVAVSDDNGLTIECEGVGGSDVFESGVEVFYGAGATTSDPKSVRKGHRLELRVNALQGNRYSIEFGGSGRIEIVGVSGRVVEMFSSAKADSHVWDASNMPSGVYLIRAISTDGVFTKRVILNQ